MNNSAVQRVSINLIVLLATTLLCAVFVEAVIRTFHKPVPKALTSIRLTESPYYQIDADLGWRPRANVTGQFKLDGSFDTTFKTNSRGLRSREFDYARTPGIRRIVVLGDSFTWGFGVNDHETYASYLETMLSNTEVINLGVTAYGLPQEIKYYELEGRKYKPDILVVGFCMNDIYRSEKPERRGDRKLGVNAQEKLSDGTFAWIKRTLAENSAAYSFLIERINTNKPLVNLLVSLGIKDGLEGFEGLDPNLAPALREYPDELQRSWELTKADILRLKRITDEAGVRLIVAVLPALQSVRKLSFEHAISYTVYETKDFDLDKPYRQLHAFLGQHNIESVDVLDRFRAIEGKEAERTLYLDRDMHFNPRGQMLFARGIADRIVGGR